MEQINYEDAKIIIIDDNEQVLESVKDALEFEKMKVITFSNPVEGLEYLRNNKVDVLLLDYYMPEMNGAEVVSKLREYNKETIIILQTGYADKVPPLDMIDRINIQGYVDKNEGIEKLILTTKSAIKTSSLLKQLKEKENQIEVLTYKKALIGDLILKLINESKDQLFQISSINSVIKKDTEDYKKENEIIEHAVNKIYELYEALNFENEKEMNITQLKKITEQLLKAKLLFNKVKLLFEIEDNSIIVNDSKDLIYLLIKTIDEIINLSAKEIIIKIKNENQRISIEINADIEFNNINIHELEILKEDENIKILLQDNSIIFKSNKA